MADLAIPTVNFMLYRQLPVTRTQLPSLAPQPLSAMHTEPEKSGRVRKPRDIPHAATSITADKFIDTMEYALCEWTNVSGLTGEDRQEAARRIRAWHAEWKATGDSSKQLWLGGLGLTSLPAILPPVRDLDVSDNALEQLPVNLPCTITSLYAYNNALTELPAYIPHSLIHLDISKNKLKKIPVVLFLRLSHIVARDNLLEDLPKLSDLPNSRDLPQNLAWFALKTLDVSRNAPGLQEKADKIIAAIRSAKARFHQLGSVLRGVPSQLKEDSERERKCREAQKALSSPSSSEACEQQSSSCATER